MTRYSKKHSVKLFHKVSQRRRKAGTKPKGEYFRRSIWLSTFDFAQVPFDSAQVPFDYGQVTVDVTQGAYNSA